MLRHSQSPVPSPSSPFSSSQMPMLASNEAVASVLPDGDQATPRTAFEWPVGMFVTSSKDSSLDVGSILYE